jgi:hypothetical protein
MHVREETSRALVGELEENKLCRKSVSRRKVNIKMDL